jgi:hypothetical protein
MGSTAETERFQGNEFRGLNGDDSLPIGQSPCSLEMTEATSARHSKPFKPREHRVRGLHIITNWRGRPAKNPAEIRSIPTQAMNETLSEVASLTWCLLLQSFPSMAKEADENQFGGPSGHAKDSGDHLHRGLIPFAALTEELALTVCTRSILRHCSTL